MITHYFKIAVRNLLKYKTQSIISILGLTVGFVCFVLSAIWIRYEMTYDTFHEDADRIYIVRMKDWHGFTQDGVTNNTPYLLAQYLKDNFAEIKAACSVQGGNGVADFNIDDETHKLSMLSIDSMAFSVFDIRILEGSNEFLTLRSGKIAITRRAAHRIFGDESPIGKEIYSSYDKTRPLTICAVVSEWPEHSNLNYDIIDRCYPNDRWGSFGWQTFVRLHDGASTKDFTKKIESLYIEDNVRLKDFLTTPITRLRYDHPLVTLDVKFQHVVLFAIASALVILCCLLNYINLFISQVRNRSREFALRMVNGASPFRLFKMLMLEYSLLLFVSWFFGMLFIEILLPYFKEVSEIQLTQVEVYLQGTVCGFFIILLSALLAAAPILYYRNQSVQSIISIHKGGKEKNYFRRAMLLSQLVISIGFIFCASVITKQLYFLNYSDVVGIERKNRAALIVYSDKDKQLLQERIKQLSEVEEVLAVNKPLIPKQSSASWTFKEWEDKTEGIEEVMVEIKGVNAAYMNFYGMTLLEGDMLASSSSGTDLVLNETAVKAFGWDKAVGKHLPAYGYTYRVVGVVKDWHINSPAMPILPAAFRLVEMSNYSNYSNCLLIKFKEGTWNQCKEKIGMILTEIYSNDTSFNLSNTEEEYNKFLTSEKALLRMLTLLALVCIFISIFGIYSQIVLTCEQRRKEIAIRKVNGANVINILSMFAKEYFWLLVVASLVAFSIGYAIMKHWLENYTLQTSIDGWIFAVIFIGIAIVVAFSIGYRVWKAANENPAKVVKSE